MLCSAPKEYALAEARERQGAAILEPWRGERGRDALRHVERRGQRQALDAAAPAHRLRRLAEPSLEGAREGLVRAVAGREREIEDVGRAGGERLGRKAETARAKVIHQRPSRALREGMREMASRDAQSLREAGEAKLALEIALDDPQGAFRQGHLVNLASCELSGGCPFGPDRGDWSYQASALTRGSE